MSYRSSRLLGALASLCLAVTLTAPLSGCGGGGSSSPTPETPPPVTPSTPAGQISGQVLNAADASPVANARISAAGATTTTDAQGRFTLAALAPAASVVLRIQADGHLDAVLPLPVTANQTTPVLQRLSAAGAAQTFAADAPGTVRVANTQASVDLPANGFVVDGGTTAATGTLSARLTVIDPVRDPSSMPGRYVSTTGKAIESFGALSVDLRDAAGNKLNLKAGTTATVRIPLATRSASAPATVPLFYLDEATGQWKQEGTATLKTTAEGSYYEGSVSHFSTWNADQEMDTIFVNGCVNDTAGKPVSLALVTATGLNYSGRSYDITEFNTGKFRVAIRKNSLAEIVATATPLSTPPVTVGPSDVDITLPACLVLDAQAVPTLVTAPVDATAVVGQQVYFSCSARGGDLRYQWQRNGVDIAGATFSTLTLAASLADDGARYACVVRNSLGSVTSTAGTLHVSAATVPVIDDQPLSANALVGDTARFAVNAVGSAPLSYQWQRNGVDIAGATSDTYSTPALALADNGARYRVVVRNAYGSTTSAEATLTVTAVVLAAPSIRTQPMSVTSMQGQTATFFVLATGNPLPTYQWLKNGVAIADATSASYVTPALTTADSGATYSVRITNSEGSATSASAVLTVLAGTGGGSDADKANLMRLLGAPAVWLQAVGAPMEVTDEQGLVLSSAAVCTAGSVSATLNGANVVVGQALPASGVLATRFSDCIADGVRYNGSASANYALNGLSAPISGDITVTLANLRMAEGSTSNDTVDGGATVNLSGSAAGGTLTQTVVVAPTNGTSITNNLLALRAVLSSGSLTVGSSTRISDERLLTSTIGYSNFSFAVAGTPYVTTGTLTLTFSATDGLPTGGTGEITLTSNSSTVGRLYFLNGQLQIEVNGTVQPFGAKGPRAAALNARPVGRVSR